MTTRLETLRRGIEDLVRSTLLWVQGVDAASKPITVKREIVPEGEDEEEEVDGTMVTYEAASGGAVSPDRLDRIARAARDVVREVKAIIDESHVLGDAVVARFVAARVGEIAPLLGVLSTATRVVLGEYVAFHRSSCKLESVLTALFLGLCAEGFCAPPEETDGESGGGMMDDQSGTGMGAGEGKRDVADEIENEDQILGAEDAEKRDEDETKDEKNTGDEEDDGGIEMQNDFEGTMEDVDAGGDDDDDDEDPARDAEKEMGEDGDDGDVIDERMWNDEDDANEDEKNRAPEKYEKGSSVKQDDERETETRGKEEEDAAPPKDPDEDAADARDDANEEDDRKNDPAAADADDDDGKVNDEEMEENHGFDPSKPEPEELELDDDFAMDEDEEDGGDDANEDESMRDEDAGELEGDANEDAPADDANENAAEGDAKDDGDGGLTEDVMDVDEEDGNGEENDDELATDNLNEDAVAGDDAMDETGDQGGPQGEGSGGGGDRDVDDARGRGGEAGASARGSEGLGEDDTEQKPNADVDGDENAANDASQLPPPRSSADAASAGADGEGTGGGASGGEGTVAPSTGGGAGDDDARPPPPQRQQDANPHRSLGDALKNWRERLNVVGDAAAETEAEEGGGADAGAEGNEYEFERNADDGATGDENADGEGGMQTLANATEEQALRHTMNDTPDDDDGGGEDVERAEMREDDRAALPEDGDQGPGNDDVAEDDDDVDASSKQRKKQSSGPKKEPAPADARAAALEGEDAVEDEEMDDELVAGGEGETGEESTIALQLENTSIGSSSNDVKRELTAEDVERARAEAERSLTEWREKSSAGDEAKAQDLWRKLEQLTTTLSAELAEKLRLILEPTLASRLQGDYKTGKRLNMRKIIPYIASDFRKDKIWLRRSRPSSRKYQVMLAIDDSRSMAENHCGHIALESMVLLARAMARLEVGEIGVVGFGAGANAVRTLHPLGAPFTDKEGPSLVSKLSFAEDNTLADRPMVQLLETMAAHLNVAREQIRGGGTKLQQLVLIIADGRFHEKEALRRCMREIGAQRGLLVAFIVLDNPKNSLLNMQSVSFTNGKPVMKKYLDSFPFPFYVLVQDVSQLPATISDLLRQWFEMAASHD